jgi:hypothetical protein
VVGKPLKRVWREMPVIPGAHESKKYCRRENSSITMGISPMTVHKMNIIEFHNIKEEFWINRWNPQNIADPKYNRT